MKMAEFIEQVKRAEAETDNFYASRSDLMHMYFDIADAIEEGYLEGVTVERPEGNQMTVHCEDGKVIVSKYRELYFDTVSNKPRNASYIRTASHYERTRAMVYATGNKWAIENFNAVH